MKQKFWIGLVVVLMVSLMLCACGGGGGGGSAPATYTVTYNGNGETGGISPTDSTNYEQGYTVTLAYNSGNLVKKGYSFTGWDTMANGSGTFYTPGQTFKMGTANVTLYATWTEINEFTIPTANSAPYDIALGPDGNLWFVEYAGNNIGRITTAGVITEFPVPTANSEPEDIAVGPDGNLWFVEFGGNKVGRITTAGVITDFPVPTANSEPMGIAVGPDGNLWFTE